MNSEVVKESLISQLDKDSQKGLPVIFKNFNDKFKKMTSKIIEKESEIERINL